MRLLTYSSYTGVLGLNLIGSLQNRIDVGSPLKRIRNGAGDSTVGPLVARPLLAPQHRAHKPLPIIANPSHNSSANELIGRKKKWGGI